jgi:hypothetical protein
MTVRAGNAVRRSLCACTLAIVAALGAAPRASAQTLTNADVIKMVQAKLGDAVIISEIKNSTCRFNTSPNALITLKQAGVSDKVLEAMTEAERGENREPAAPASPRSNATIPVPEDYGIYAVVDGHLIKLDSQQIRANETVAVKLGQRNGVGNILQGQSVAGSTVAQLPEFAPDLKVLVFSEASGLVSPLSIAESLSLEPLVFVRYVTVDTGFPSHVRRSGVEEGWDSGQPPELLVTATGQRPEPLEFLFKPMPGHNDMVIATPSRALKPGVYRLGARGANPFPGAGGILFAIPPISNAQAAGCVDVAITYLAITLSDSKYTPCSGASASPEPAAANVPPPFGSAGARLGAAPAPASCGDYQGCLRAGINAFRYSNLPAAVSDFQAASNLNATTGDPWLWLGRTYLRTGENQNFTLAWDKALSLGGTVIIGACHERAFRPCQRGGLSLSAKAVSFLANGSQAVFAVPPAEVAGKGVFNNPDTAHVSFGLRAENRNFNFDFLPLGVACGVQLFVQCPAEGVSQQLAVANYVEQTIPKLASGAFAPAPKAPSRLPTASALAAQPSQTSTPGIISKTFALSEVFGAREVIQFQVTQPGKIALDAFWGGNTRLALILNGPGKVGAYARKDGTSPLGLEYQETAQDLNRGDQWRASIVNFSRVGPITGTLRVTIPATTSGAPIPPVSPAQSPAPAALAGGCTGAPDLGYSIRDGQQTFAVKGFGPPGPNRVHVFLDETGAVVRDRTELQKLALGAWTKETIVDRYNVGIGSGQIKMFLAVSGNLEGWEDATDVLARATVESIKAVVTGGASLSTAPQDLTLGVVKNQLTNPKVALAHWARAGLEQSLADYTQMEGLLPSAGATVLELSNLKRIESLYMQANTLASVNEALAAAMAPTTWQDEFANYISSAISQLRPSLPASATLLTLNDVLKLEQYVAATGQSFSAYKQSLDLALGVATSTQQKISAWAIEAAMACGSTAAGNAPPQARSSKTPTGQRMPLQTPRGVVWVKNFYSKAVATIPNTVIIRTDNGSASAHYDMGFHPSNSQFYIMIDASVLLNAIKYRMAAEQQFLDLLDVSRGDACKLNVVVQINPTSPLVGNPPNGLKEMNYGLSFCPGSAPFANPSAEGSGTNNGTWSVDFLNFSYPSACWRNWPNSGFSRVIHVSDGKWEHGAGSGQIYFGADKPIYTDLTRDGREEAVVVTDCAFTSSDTWSTEVLVFGMVSGKPRLLTTLKPSDWDVPSWGIAWEVKKVRVENGEIAVSYLSGGYHAQPAWVATAFFRRNGSRFVRARVDRKPFGPPG